MRERRDAAVNGFRRLSIRFWAALTVSGALTSAVALPLTTRALDARDPTGGFETAATDDRAARLDGQWGPGGGMPEGSAGASGGPDGRAHDAADGAAPEPTTRSAPTTAVPATTTTAAPATTGDAPTAPVATTPPPTAPPIPPAPTTTAAPTTTPTTAPPPTTTASGALLDGVIVISPEPDEPALAVELSVGGGGVSVPVTEEACRNGGWADHDVAFVSQSQCLTFVRRIDPTIAVSVGAGLPLTSRQLASIELELDALGLLTGVLGGVTGLLNGVTGLLGG